MSDNDRIAAGLPPQGPFIGRMSQLLLAHYDELAAALREVQRQGSDGNDEDNE